jgi:Na+-driven multidrug efflux pump
MGRRLAEIGEDLRAAFRGEEQDYTETPLNRAILLLAVPMVLEMCMESLFGIVNIFWVAHLGAPTAAAVGVTESLMSLVYSVALGVAMATTAMVARRIGEKNEEGAARAAGQSILLGILCAVVLGIPGAIYDRELLRWMGGDASVVEAGGSYARIIIGNSLSVMLLFLMNAVFRGAGDAAIAMRVLWSAASCTRSPSCAA